MILAETDQRIPNPNPLSKINLVPYQKAMVDVQANSTIYQELIKQLELAKVTHRNKAPLIQIIDEPIYPLENSNFIMMFEGGVQDFAKDYRITYQDISGGIHILENDKFDIYDGLSFFVKNSSSSEF